MQITDLGGHSGCKILLYETDDNETFVRKVSSSFDYNKRLEIQAKKQERFSGQIVRSPKILNKGYTQEGLFFFDMEYIQGITLAEYMNSIEIGKVRSLVEAIVNNLIFIDNEQVGDSSVFEQKITSLEEKLSKDNNDIVNKAIKLLKEHDWCKFNQSDCHGDLTLENIIVKNNQLYLIDFLDSFYDCWLLDVCTLLQDVQILWSYRREKEININTLLRLIVFRDILIDEVKKLLQKDYVEVYYALLLKLIRIYPYTKKDEQTYSFLNQKTEQVMQIISEVK